MEEHVIISRDDAIEHLLISELEDLDCNGGYNDADQVRIQAELEALSSAELVQRYRLYVSEDPEYLVTVELM
jgi:hypothetical protein